MSRASAATLLSAALALSASVGAAQQPAGATAAASSSPSGRVHHSLKVTLDPTRGWLSVEDVVTVPAGSSGPGRRESLGMTGVELLLHAGLRITASEPAVEEVQLGDTSRFLGINSSSVQAPLKRYRVAAPNATVRLRYEGRFDFGLSDQKEEYTRGFRETAG
ncbi:MAG TPA: hypothetical protein VLL75_17575, partial [Vicinamibacteria bacterium]|nr:hypothetical protein [Vicinamibacteria bacterium]